MRTVSVSLFLYFKPGIDMDIEGSEITGGDIFRRQGELLHKHLTWAGNAIDRLIADGWKCEGGLFDLSLFHSEVQSAETARARLTAALGSDEGFTFYEEKEEEEEEDVTVEA